MAVAGSPSKLAAWLPMSNINAKTPCVKKKPDPVYWEWPPFCRRPSGLCKLEGLAVDFDGVSAAKEA
jgi:hypothetical protein